MDRAEALAAAERARGAAKVPEGHALVQVEQRIIELPEPAEGPARVRDCRVWVASFLRGTILLEVALDDATGAVVRVQ